MVRMETLSVSEAAARLGVNHKVIRRLIAQRLVDATMRMGRHGREWRINAASLESYRERTYGEAPERDAPASAGAPIASRPAAPSAHLVEELREDKRFLRDQLDRLTSILQNGGPAPCPETSAASAPGPKAVTASLQQALRMAGPDAVSSLEFTATRLLWGRPVLWRMAARDAADVSALIDAVLSSSAEWDPPAGECLLVVARNADGDVLWGTACGPGWFGPRFVEALRGSRVERL